MAKETLRRFYRRTLASKLTRVYQTRSPRLDYIVPRALVE